MSSPGSLIGGDFRVERLLARGGMGDVYVAKQVSTGAERALKLLRRELAADADARGRFELEARVGSKIESAHVVEVVAAGVDDATGAPFLAMELLEGEDLAARLGRAGPLELPEVLRLFRQLCHAVGAAHATGIVHRDLKPENVFLAEPKGADDGDFVVKVLDFGLAKLTIESTSLERGRTGAGALLGTPLWMAPEQADNVGVTPAADVWALGLLLYQTLTGRSLWRTGDRASSSIAEILREILLEPIPSATARAREQGVGDRFPVELEPILNASVVRAVRSRYPDATTFWLALDAAMRAPASAAPREAPAPIGGATGASTSTLRTSPEASPAFAATQRAIPSSFAAPPRPSPPSPEAAGRSLGKVALAAFAIFAVAGAATILWRETRAALPPRCRLCTVEEESLTFANGPQPLGNIRAYLEEAFPTIDRRCLKDTGASGRMTMKFVLMDDRVERRQFVALPAGDKTAACIGEAVQVLRLGPPKPTLLPAGAATPPELGMTRVSYTLDYDDRAKP